MWFIANLFIFHDLTWLLQRIESIFYLFYWWDLLVLFCFLFNQENLLMIYYDWDLFSDIYGTITEHNQRQTPLPFIDFKLFWSTFFSESKTCFISSSVSSLIMIAMFLNALYSLHDYLWKKQSYLLIICGRNKVICWLNFPCVRLFQIIYDVFWIWSNFLKIFFNWEFFIPITITFIFNIIVTPKVRSFSFSKGFLMSLIIWSLIVLISFSSVKRFLTSLIAV